jgi:signal transduction histidine kinase
VLNIAIEEKEDIVLDKEKTDITALVESIIANHTIKAAKPIQLLFNNGMQGGSVVVDKMHFANALNNLVDNAIKYSGDEVQVIIITEKTISGWVLRVQDNGVGIPKIYQEAVFDKFFRVPSGDLHNVKGFGLGLSYVKKIIEKHGGSIALQSEPGKGSVFEIRMEHG